MWQKSSLLQAHGGPLTGIESGRILANGALFEGGFHANPNGAFYGISRERVNSEKWNPGPYRAYLGEGYLGS